MFQFAAFPMMFFCVYYMPEQFNDTMWLLSFVSHRASLQWDPSVIWLWPGALRRAPASPRPSLLHRIPVLLATTPFQEPEQPRHPVLRLTGVHAFGNVTGATSTNMSDTLTVSLSSQCCCCCCSLPHLPLAALLLLPDYCIVLHCPLPTHHPTLLAVWLLILWWKVAVTLPGIASSTVCV